MGFDTPATSAGTDVSARSVSGAYNVKEDYSAAGDGVRDDTASIQAAINDANAAGGGVVFFPPGTFYLNNATAVQPKSNVQFWGSGIDVTVIKASDGFNVPHFDTLGQTTANSTTTTGAIAAGDRFTTLTSATGYVFGDVVEITVSSPITRYFCTRVTAVDGTTIYFEEHCPIPFASGATVRRVTARCTNWSVRDMTFRSQTGEPTTLTTRFQGALKCNGSDKLTIERVAFVGIGADGSGSRTVQLTTCRSVRLQNCYFEKCYDHDPSPSQTSMCVQVDRCMDVVQTGNVFRRCGGSKSCCHISSINVIFSNNIIGGNGGRSDRLLTTSTGSQTLPVGTFNVASTTGFTAAGKLWVSNGTPPYASNPSLVTYTGGGGGGTSFTGCTGGTGTVVAGTSVMQANTNDSIIGDSGGRGVSWEDWTANFVCADNIFHDSGFDGIRCDGAIEGVIRGNQIFNARDVAVYIVSSSGDSTVKSNAIRVSDNRIYWDSRIGTDDHGIQVGDGSIDAVITGNHLHNFTGLGIHLVANNTGCIIAHNRLDTNTSGGGSYGIRIDGGGTSNTVQGNTITNTLSAAIRTADSAGANYILDNNVGTLTVEPAATDYFRPSQEQKALTYSSSITPSATLGSYLTLSITNGTAFTINAPTNPTAGRELSFDIKNASGGAHGAITWSTTYLGGGAGTVGTGAFATIANGKRRIIVFRYDGTNWIEVSRTADI